MKKTISFLLFWLTWGFGLGTYILLGPLRDSVNASRELQITGQDEKSTVYRYIALLIVGSFLIALGTNRLVWRAPNRILKSIFAGLPLLTFCVAVYIMMRPDIVNKGAVDQHINAQGANVAAFSIGPYPDLAKMEQLKKDGYVAVISLLHPAVVPFEPALLAEEKANASQAGVDFIHIPLLPWVSDNKKGLDSLRSLVKNARGKHYIHCYLGKDRANVARKLIEQESRAYSAETGIDGARKLSGIKKFERGQIYQLAEDIFLTPLPTDEEFYGYVMAGEFRYVISLVDGSDSYLREINDRYKTQLETLGIPIQLMGEGGLSSFTPTDLQQVINKAGYPLLIYSFKTDDMAAAAVLAMYPQAKPL